MYQSAPLLAKLRAELENAPPDLTGKVNRERLLDAYV